MRSGSEVLRRERYVVKWLRLWYSPKILSNKINSSCILVVRWRGVKVGGVVRVYN